MPLDIAPLPALSDNYIFLLTTPGSRQAAVVDPGEAGPVIEELEHSGRLLTDILLTHHHGDHTGGVAALRRAFPGARVTGAAGDAGRLPSPLHGVREGDRREAAGAAFRVLETPGHTLGHLAFFFPGEEGGDLFSGDTLFAASIGYLFEGTPAQMFASLQKVRELPPTTRIWCAHEYTRATLKEALGLDPGHPGLLRRREALAAAPAKRCTVPLSLAEECATNPFLRWDDPGLTARLGTPPGLPAFTRLCAGS